MTRLGHGALKPRLTPQDVAEIIGGARARAKGVLRGHDLGVNLPPKRPMILADGVLLEQVVVNILDNAAKYSPEGSTITMGALHKGARVEMSIADRGPGIRRPI